MKHHSIQCLEIPAHDLSLIESFYSKVFSWSFKSYGPEYLAFESDEFEGGFFQSKLQSKPSQGSVLVIIYSEDLEKSLDQVVYAGGSISHPVFSFPGGRRFHFNDPCGNELAIWSDYKVDGSKIALGEVGV